jgi:crossover junction endodeoxyribonuclease RuvC
VVEFGVVQVKRRSTSFPQRLHDIHERLCAVIARTHPEACALEAVFFAKNVKSIVQLSQARGVALLACAQARLEPVEYTPMQVKRSVTGRGAASKSQVSAMVQAILHLDTAPEPYDATDALAVAICHAVNNGQVPKAVPRGKKVSDRTKWAEFVKERRTENGERRTKNES